MAGTHGSAREEAERLAATVLAMAAQASGGADRRPLGGLGDLLATAVGALAGRAGSGAAGGGPDSGPGGSDPAAAHASRSGWAIGGAECCVCPICRIMVALRDPDAHTAERLATGAGDFAAGVASLLRSLADVSAAGHRRTTAPEDAPTGSSDRRSGAETADGCHDAAARHRTGTDPADGDAVWRAATRKPEDTESAARSRNVD